MTLKWPSDFGFIPGKVGAFPIRFDAKVDLRPGAITYVPAYTDFDDYAQACIEGRA